MDELIPGVSLTTEQIQRLLFAALCDFDDLCTDAGIPYWLDGGTLLGAYREHDLLAWDDDIDVCTEDHWLQRIVEVRHLLPGHLSLVVSSKGSGPAARILLTQTRAVEKTALYGLSWSAQHLFIDIFTMQSAHSRVRHRIATRAGKLVRLAPMSRDVLSSTLPLTRMSRTAWIAASWVPAGVLRIADRFAQPPAHPTGYLTYSYHLATPECRLPSSDFLPLASVKLRGRRFPSPRNPAQYLRAMYGVDYMTPPPPSDRQRHLQSAIWKPTNH